MAHKTLIYSKASEQVLPLKQNNSKFSTIFYKIILGKTNNSTVNFLLLQLKININGEISELT
jgi:hypothetical protein